MSLSGCLIEAERFSRAIDRIASRRTGSRSEVELEIDGVCLATLWRKRDAAGKHIASDLLAGRLPALPGRLLEVRIGNKTRRLFEFPLVEMIVHDAVAEWLSELTETTASPRLFSYRRGRSSHEAVTEFAKYVRRHRRQALKTRPAELFVIRRDVASYFDSIPTHDGAPVWSRLAALVGNQGDRRTHDLVRRVVRPRLLAPDGGPLDLKAGIPTGSPVANVIANLYLADVDVQAGSVRGAFYARYGDDLLAAHADAATACAIRDMLARGIAEAGLVFSTHKSRDLALTASGRPVANQNGDFVPVPAIDFLGYSVGVEGNIWLPAPKVRALLVSLRAAAARAARAAGPREVRAKAIVDALNRRLDPDDALAHPHAAELQCAVTDRRELMRLDHELALIAIEALLGHRGPRGFREWPPRRLRNEFGLCSLVAKRNRA